MPTYNNCFELVKEVRLGIDEYDDALVSGEDIVGAFNNDFILKQINLVIRELHALIAKRRPSEFLKEESLTAVDSVLTLPSDFGKLVLFRDPFGKKVYSINQDERRFTENTGSERLYYMKGSTLVLDKAGISDTYSLIYKSKPRDIHHGKTSAGGTNSMTLDADRAVKIADYYNGMILEDVTGDAAYTITDYTSARVATISGTGTAGNLYGLVPEIPEWAHVLIGPKAVIYVKNHPKSKEKPSKTEIAAYQDMFLMLFREYATPDEDVNWEEMFTSFEPKTGGLFF
jgi:hypothetical protein